VRHALIAGLLLACGARDARAQSADAPSVRPHRVVVSGGLVLSGSYALGDQSARYRSNGLGAAPGFDTLFTASSSLARAAGGTIHVGVPLSSRVMVEVGGTLSQPMVRTSLAEDQEAVAITIDGDRLLQATVDAGLAWQVPAPALGGRARPFVAGGAGYLRQRHEARTLVETGSVAYVGGGLRYWLHGGDGTRRSLGVRADARAVFRRHGVDFADAVRAYPEFGLQLFIQM
jgi:hypothetical protein